MIKFLVYSAILLGIIAATQLMRVFELASELKGTRHYEIKEADNRRNGKLMFWFMVTFMLFCFWQVIKYKDKLLPVAASIEGVELDWLLNFNFIIIWVVFIITNVLLFWFSYKYYGRDNAVAHYYPHNNKLEILWTTVPAVVLAVIIILGLKSWTTITAPADPNMRIIELYAKQFDWTARYAGTDNTLGGFSYKLITASNPLGVDANDPKTADDFTVKGEFHIPINQPVEFKIRSRDVIHSAYMPHFRQQMNAVPGMITFLHFTPTITSKRMKEITNNPNFEYLLLCNKICGASHYNMQMNIIVDTQEEFDAWLKKQKPNLSAAPATADAAEIKEGK